MWMIQAGDGASFALKALAQLGTVREMNGKNFNGDNSIEAGITSLINLAHSTRANGGEDFMRAKTLSGSDCHFFNPAAQLRTTVIGADAVCSGAVLIRNRCASAGTAYRLFLPVARV